MNGTKAFYIVSGMIAEKENYIEEAQEFVLSNKGNQKLKEEVTRTREKIQETRKELKPLYSIRNGFY